MENKVKVGEREFTFVRITPNSEKHILKKCRVTFRDYIAKSLFPYGKEKREWKKVRNFIFEKNFAWKYFKIIPKELRCNNILLTEAGGIQAGFFGYYRDKVSEYKRHLDTVRPVQTEKSPEKSEA